MRQGSYHNQSVRCFILVLPCLFRKVCRKKKGNGNSGARESFFWCLMCDQQETQGENCCQNVLLRPFGATVEAAHKNKLCSGCFEKSRPLRRPRSAGLCAGINPFLFRAGCQEQASGKTGTWQTEMQLPAGDEDHPVGSWTFPDDSRSCL